MRIPKIMFIVLSILIFAVSARAAEQVFYTKSVTDTHGFQIEAFSLLMPRGWHFDGGVNWDLARRIPEATSSFTLTSPDHSAVVEQHPLVQQAWAADPALRYNLAASGMGVMQPLSAADWLKTVFIPHMRGGVNELKILKTTPQPDLARQYLELSRFDLQMFERISPSPAPVDLKTDSSRVKIQYLKDNRRITEELTASILYTTTILPTPYGAGPGMTQWSILAVSTRASETQYQRLAPVFDTILRSYRTNPRWGASYNRLLATITRSHVQMARRDIERRMQQIGRRLQETSEMIDRGYKQRSRIQDRMFDAYSRSVRDVDQWDDPTQGRRVELPAGYNRAWTDGARYIISDNPAYDPNADHDMGGDWQSLTRGER